MSDAQQPTSPQGGDLMSAGATILRDGGYRMTPQRRAILDYFGGEGRHRTPQDIFAALESQVESLSLATVYNTLELFHDIGLLHKFSDQDGQTYFDPNLKPHHHAVCDDCGEIFDLNVSTESVESLISSSTMANRESEQFQVQETTIWFRGACAECRRSLH
ncbi:MAG: Fur family transcriptional regulator [Myxococcota bacterium]